MELPAALYDRTSRRLRTPGIVAIGLLAALLLTPLLLFPLGPDASLFFVAGEKIVDQGAVHYRDIVDVKPPLIYYFNALSIILFGDNPASPRLLDFLVQLVASISFFFVVRRAGGSDAWGAFATLLYPVLYIGVSAQGTTQTESMVAPLLAAGLLLYLGERRAWRFGLIGLLCGIALLFKFTLGILLIGFILGDLLFVEDRLRSRLRLYGAAAAGGAVILLLFLLYLSAFDAWTGLNQMREWTAGYAGMQFASISSFVATLLVELPVKLADEYSLAMLIGTIVALWGAFFGRRIDADAFPLGNREGGARPDDVTRLLLGHLGIQFLLLMTTVVLEGKWMHYHVLRFYGPGALLASWGLIVLVGRLGQVSNRRVYWLALPLLAFLLLGLSPLSRYAFHSRPALDRISGGVGAFDDYYGERLSGNGWSYREIEEVGRKVRDVLAPEEDLAIVSGVASLLYLSAERIPTSSVFHSGFVIAPYAPPAWRQETIRHIVEGRPRFVVIQTNDRMPMITTIDSSSWETLGRWPQITATLDEAYRQVDSTNSFLVFERVDDRPARYRSER